MQKKPLVIYHAHCADGVAAAWCFFKLWGDDVEFHAGKYGDKTPDVAGRNVYMVDFAYPLEVMRKVVEVANEVVLLDHHVSSLEALKALDDDPKFDSSWATIEKSGCAIAWDYTQMLAETAAPMPDVLRSIQDRDLWVFHMHSTKSIMSYIFSFPIDIQTLDWHVSHLEDQDNFRDACAIGLHLQRQHAMMVSQIIDQQMRPMMVDEQIVPCVNAPGQYASDIGNVLAKRHPFSATYYDTQFFRHFSLRSDGDREDSTDVSVIAKKYGGGGHKHAAGFKVNRNHKLAQS